MSIPFEALDVQWGRKIDLSLSAIFNKVVLHKRGGYCYELNHLFHALLNEIGFTNHLISARVFDDEQFGPAHDHMAIVVQLDEPWLVDVGYGDLFLKPIKIQPGIQQEDSFKFYKIEETNDHQFVLTESLKTTIEYKPSYSFSTKACQISDFEEQNMFKYSSAASHFKKNLLCTIATKDGRKTIRNNIYKNRIGDTVERKEINGKEELNQLLASEFGITP